MVESGYERLDTNSAYMLKIINSVGVENIMLGFNLTGNFQQPNYVVMHTKISSNSVATYRKSGNVRS